MKCILTAHHGHIIKVITIVNTNATMRALQNVQVWTWWAANVIQPNFTRSRARWIPGQIKRQNITEILILTLCHPGNGDMQSFCELFCVKYFRMYRKVCNASSIIFPVSICTKKFQHKDFTHEIFRGKVFSIYSKVQLIPWVHCMPTAAPVLTAKVLLCRRLSACPHCNLN